MAGRKRAMDPAPLADEIPEDHKWDEIDFSKGQGYMVNGRLVDFNGKPVKGKTALMPDEPVPTHTDTGSNALGVGSVHDDHGAGDDDNNDDDRGGGFVAV